jgi:DNA-directed RNA polymerases I and III subunit RPAC1
VHFKQILMEKNYKKKSKINKHAPTQTETVDYHSAFYKDDNSFQLENFKENFKIEIQKLNQEEMIFDMIGIDAPLANAFRRIMISEVPTMAIEKVVVVNNTSLIQDEVLAHRLGLIPIHADPRLFHFPKKRETTTTDIDTLEQVEELELFENETILFQLDISCKKEKDGKVVNSVVKSNELKWVAFGNQKKNFPQGIRPVHEDIIIAKLSPGQTIHVELYCQKGVGKDHAKFSPVSTAHYRILPEISFTKKIKGEEAKKIKELCPLKVFDIEEEGVLVAKRPRDCTMCRECIRKDDEVGIQLERVKDHFICKQNTPVNFL